MNSADDASPPPDLPIASSWASSSGAVSAYIGRMPAPAAGQTADGSRTGPYSWPDAVSDMLRLVESGRQARN